MLKRLLFLFIISSTLFNYAQEVKGIVYDAEATVKGIKVLNITQKTITATNNIGEFSLKAKVSDTLFFESLFHEPKYVIVNKDYFTSTYVFELKKAINQLEEVYIKDQPKAKPFENEAYNANMNEIIALDKKKEPQKYSAAPSYGLDFIQIFGMIGKLFKKKKKPIPYTLDYKKIKLLFETNSYFNKQMLSESFKIPEDYHSLYFEFCETKHIPESLLSYNKKLELLNFFTLYSEEFLLIIEMSETETKD